MTDPMISAQINWSDLRECKIGQYMMFNCLTRTITLTTNQ